MSKDQPGRIGGHHLTPGQGWRWQEFSGRLMLVTDGGGADLVLSAWHAGGGRTHLVTCGPDGLLVRLTPDSPLAHVLQTVPAMVDLLREIVVRDDRPRYLPQIAGLLLALGIVP